MSGQLWIDGEMVGPLHGPGIPGPDLPDAAQYTTTAAIAVDGTPLHELRKHHGREQYRARHFVWVWRDSIAIERAAKGADHAIEYATAVDSGERIVLGIVPVYLALDEGEMP